MNRREFFKAGVGAVAVGIAARPGWAAEPARRIRIGFLGVAHSHAAQKVKLVRQSADWELVGLCDASAALRASPAAQGVPSLSEEELLGACEVVAVESAVRDHARHAKLALEAGKHVHLEKPPAATLAAFQELQRLAREKQRLLQIGYMWRFHPGLNAALEAARKGWLGDVHLVRATINTHLAADTRRAAAEFRGGMMFELGCHLLDPVVRLLGRPTAVTSSLKKHGSFEDTLADNTTAVLEFAKATAIVTSAAMQPNAGSHRSFEIIGSNGTVLVQPLEPPALVVDLSKPAGPYRAGSQTVILPPYQRFADEFIALAKAIRDQTPLAVSPEEDALVHETLLRACQMHQP